MQEDAYKHKLKHQPFKSKQANQFSTVTRVILVFLRKELSCPVLLNFCAMTIENFTKIKMTELDKKFHMHGMNKS